MIGSQTGVAARREEASESRRATHDSVGTAEKSSDSVPVFAFSDEVTADHEANTAARHSPKDPDAAGRGILKADSANEGVQSPTQRIAFPSNLGVMGPT